MSAPTTNPNAKFLGGEAPAATARTLQDCNAITIACELKDRADLKANHKKAYLALKEQCESGLKEKFEFHDFSELTDDKKQGMTSISSTVSKRNELFRQLNKRGMINVFIVPEEMILDTATGEWVPKSSKGSISLETDYSDITLEHVKRAVMWQNKYGPSYFVKNNSWSETMILNSCEASLKMKVLEDLEKCDDDLQRGGPTAFYIMMKHVLSASEESMNGIIDHFKNWKLTDVDGENVHTASTIISNIHTVLKDNNALPGDFKTQVFDFFSHSMCDDFKTGVLQMKGYNKSGVKTYTIDDILKELSADYTSKLAAGKWTAKDTKKGQNSGFVTGVLCFNCGGIGHTVKDCPKPIDQEQIDIRKKLMFPSGRREKRDRRNGNGNGNRNTDEKTDEKDSESKPKDPAKPKDPKRQPPKSGESHEKNIDGAVLHWCGKCGRWGNHKTADHKTREELKQAKENPTTDQQGSFAAGATALNF